MGYAGTTFGFELEYASGVAPLVGRLADYGLDFDAPHRYHCDCENCAVRTPRDRRYISHSYLHDPEDEDDDPDTTDPVYLREWYLERVLQGEYPLGPGPTAGCSPLHVQRDSTADGEFVTNILDDWREFKIIVDALTSSAVEVGARPGQRCGLHVHVQPPHGTDRPAVALAYLAYERYFVEIMAPGASNNKRDMNKTLMEAVRECVSDCWFAGTPAEFYEAEGWKTVARERALLMVAETIGRDRHVDFNIPPRTPTCEFRTFNSTNAPWRIELACRTAVAFTLAANELITEVERAVRGGKFWPEGCDSPWGEILRPAWSQLAAPRPTKKPVVTFARFVEILASHDPALLPLIQRQAAYMRARYAREVPEAAA